MKMKQEWLKDIEIRKIIDARSGISWNNAVSQYEAGYRVKGNCRKNWKLVRIEK